MLGPVGLDWIAMPLPFHQNILRRFGATKTAFYLGSISRHRIACNINSLTMHLDLSETIQRQMYLGPYEAEQTEWAKRLLKPGARVVDVGANFGYYTTLASSLIGAEGSIFAFEPSPIAAAVIADMIAVNGLRNVMLVRSALGREAGHVDLFMPLDTGLHSPSLFTADGKYEPVRVPLIALDDFEPLRDGVPIDLVKIDAEGSEPDVIEGMTGLIAAGLVKNLFCELNSGWLRRNNSSPEILHERIIDLGFEVHSRTEKVTGMETPEGPPFELQDIWYRWPG
jgi:FkbM family methyltransferase